MLDLLGSLILTIAKSTDSKKRLALAIIDYLNTSAKDGTVDAADAESIEVATNCIAEAFHVDATDEAAIKDALGGQNLLSIYGVYEKLKGRSTASTEGPSSAKEGRPASPVVPKKDEGTKGTANAESEKLKGQGNAAMQKKEYKEAVDFYTQALEIAPLNPIYLSNRAAAYSNLGQHEFAKNDAELATATDPKYTKAWSRLGLALFALGDAKGSMEAYQKGIEAEGNGGSDAMKRGFETAKKRFEEEGGADELESARGADAGGFGGGAGGLPDLGALGSMFGGGRGGGGGGGMPDLAGIMNNPMMRQMAQNLMSNPQMMDNLMNNPQLRQMAESFGGGGGRGGGGMPDMSALMNDPSIAEM